MAGGSQRAGAAVPAGIHKIKHVIVIMQDAIAPSSFRHLSAKSATRRDASGAGTTR
jgi:hypothetical protein